MAGARLITPRPPGTDVPRVLRSQRDLLDVCAAEADRRVPAYPMVAVSVPRRSGKTTMLLALALGRCAAWPQYHAIYTAQTGIKSRERFYDLLRSLSAAGGSIGGWRARESRGEERIELANGSVLRFAPPKPDSFRSDACDLALLDEAQAHDLVDGGELLAAVLPTLDTRPLAQVIVAGTATLDRDRLLWRALESGRSGQTGWGIAEYAAQPGADLEDPATWWATHPGLADGLTTIAKITANHAELGKFGPEHFHAEYLGVWGEPATSAGFSAETWAACGAEQADLPTVYAIGYDCAPDSSTASVAAAWRPRPGGPVHVELLVDRRPGTSWLVDYLAAHRGKAVVGYDSSAMGTLDIADRLATTRPRHKLAGLSTAGYVTACGGFARLVIDAELRHPRQPGLDAAVAGAVRRQIGDSGWGWGRRRSDVDITPLVAATVAVRTLETTRPPSKPRIRAAASA